MNWYRISKHTEIKHFAQNELLPYLENAENITIEFLLQKLIGKTPREVQNSVSYLNLYLGNKYGIGPEYDQEDKIIQTFANALSYFVTRIFRTTELDRLYHPESYQDIKDAHNYDEFRVKQMESAKKRTELFKTYIAEKDDVKKSKIRDRMHQIMNEVYETTEWGQFEQKTRKQAEDIRRKLGDTPLTWQELKPDNSQEFQSLAQAFNDLKKLKSPKSPQFDENIVYEPDSIDKFTL